MNQPWIYMYSPSRSPSHLPLHLIPLGLPSAPGPSTCLMLPAWAEHIHPCISFLTLPLKTCPQLDDLTNKGCCILVLEARSLKSRCWQGWFLLSWKEAFQASHLTSISLGTYWLIDSILSLCLPTWSFLCPNFPLLLRTWLCQIRAHPNDLTLTW